jgi:hypothetical protein
MSWHCCCMLGRRRLLPARAAVTANFIAQTTEGEGRKEDLLYLLAWSNLLEERNPFSLRGSKSSLCKGACRPTTQSCALFAQMGVHACGWVRKDARSISLTLSRRAVGGGELEVPSGIPILIPRAFGIPQGFGIPNPFGILFNVNNVAPIFFLWIKSHQIYNYK